MDIANYGNRNDAIQQHQRQALYGVITRAFEASQLAWDNCHREDRGDGVLVVIPDHAQSWTAVDPLLERLHAGLRHHNRVASTAAQIRLRVAVHSGQVHFDAHGVAGHAVIHLFRLLDAPELKKALAASGDDLALIVSDHYYENVIQHSPGMIDPEAFRPIRVAVKETRTRGWLHLPKTSPNPPQPQPSETGVPATHTFSDARININGVIGVEGVYGFRWER